MKRTTCTLAVLLGLCGATLASAQDVGATAATGTAWKRHVIDDSSRGADGIRLSRTHGVLEIATAWEQGGQVRLCRQPKGGDVRSRWPSVKVGVVEDGEDAVLVDLDGDGAEDVVSCSEGKTRAIHVHWAPANEDRRVEQSAWSTEVLPASNGAMMWMYALPLDVNGDGRVDLVAGGKGKNAAIGWFEAPARPRAQGDWTWHSLRPAGWVMSLVAADMDADGDADVVFSDRKGARSGAFWLENPGAVSQQKSNWTEHAIGGQGEQAMFLSLADVDADRLTDVLLAAQPKSIMWFRRESRNGLGWDTRVIPQPEPTGIAKAVAAGDIDLDGRSDLVFSCEQAKAPAEGLMWLSHGPAGGPGGWTAHRLSGPDGVKHDLVELVDLDGDGDLDVMTTEEVQNLGVIWYENPTRSRAETVDSRSRQSIP